jgi:hypothetical protein
VTQAVREARAREPISLSDFSEIAVSEPVTLRIPDFNAGIEDPNWCMKFRKEKMETDSHEIRNQSRNGIFQMQ